MYGIYANIWGILMVNVTIYGIHGSYGFGIFLKGAIGAINIGRTGTPRALPGPGGRNHGASQWWKASQLCAPREAK